MCKVSAGASECITTACSSALSGPKKACGRYNMDRQRTAIALDRLEFAHGRGARL